MECNRISIESGGVAGQGKGETLMGGVACLATGGAVLVLLSVVAVGELKQAPRDRALVSESWRCVYSM